MTVAVARLLAAAIPLLLIGAAAVLAGLLLSDQRRARRVEAALTERRARPPCVPAATLLDELALLRSAIRGACCPGWWTAGRYTHHPDCTAAG
ncbi:hypothetical protein [Streptomyces hebeiensis]